MNVTTSPPTPVDTSDLTSNEYHIIYIVRVIACALNLLGTLVIVSSILLYRRYTIFESRLILFLSICAGLSTFSWFVPDVSEAESPSLCAFQAVWANFFDWSLVMWIFVFAINTYASFAKHIRTDRWEYAFHVAVWGVSSFFTVIPLFNETYGDSGTFCWLRTSAMRFGTFYIELFIIFVIVIVLYVLVLKVLRDQARVAKVIGSARGESEAEAARRHSMEGKIKAYVLVFIILWLPAIINRLHQLFADRPEFWLVLLHSVCVPLQGFVNSLIYASTEEGTLRMLRNPIEAFRLARDVAAGKAKPAASAVQEYNMQTSYTEDDNDNGGGNGGAVVEEGDSERFDNVKL
jgi:hypothetical protein